MAKMTAEEARALLASPEPAPAARGRMSAAEARAMLAQASPGEAPTPQVDPLTFAADIPRQFGRGVTDLAEFAGDVLDVSPGGQLIGAVGEAAFTDRALPQTLAEMPFAQAWNQSRGQGQGVLSSTMNALAAGYTRESAGDRLRRYALDVTDPVTKRRTPETDNPLIEGPLTAAWFTGGSLIPGGSVANVGRTALASGVGAGIGRAGAEIAELDDIGTLVAEIVGAVTGGLAGVKGLPAAVKRLSDRLRSAPAEVQTRALEQMTDAIVGPGGDQADMLAALEAKVRQGDVGTLGRLTDEPGAWAVETLARKGTGRAAADSEARALELAAREQGLERLGAVTPGDAAQATLPMAARASAASEQAARVGSEQAARGAAQTDTLLTEARAARDLASEPLKRYGSVEGAGGRLSTAVDEAEELAKAAEKTAWSTVPADELASTAKIKAGLDDLIDNLEPASKRRFMAAYADEIADVEALGPAATGAELSDLRSVVSQAYKAADAAKQPSQGDRFVAMLSNTIKEVLDDVPGGEAYRAARKATRDRFEAFAEGPLGRARAAASRAGKPAALGEAMSPRGTGGGAAADAIYRAGRSKPGVIPAQAASLEAQFARETQKGGEFSVTAARNWLAQRAEVLERFPTVKWNLEQILKANQAGVAAEKALPRAQEASEKALAARAAARQKAIGASPTAQFGQYEEGARAAEKALASTRPVETAKQLASSARKQGGTALDDLRASYMGAYLNKIAPAGKLKGGAEDVLAGYDKALAEVLSPEQMRDMRSLVEPLERMMTPPAGTAEAIEQMVGIEPSELFVTLARIGAAKGGGMLSNQPLIAANMASAKVRDLTYLRPNKDYVRFVTDYVLHPEKYLADMRQLETAMPPAQAASLIDNMFQRAGVAPAAGARATREE